MPAFSVYGAADRSQADRVNAAVREFLKTQSFQLTDRRIFRLDYVHNGESKTAEVGRSLYGEPVVLIFEGVQPSIYYVCTPNRGVVRGEPIMVGVREVHSAVDFDPD